METKKKTYVDDIDRGIYDIKNKVIHEIKRSDKVEKAHEWQVKYYIYVLERNGIKGATGILEYPTLRQTSKVELTDEDRKRIRKIEIEIKEIIENENCPTLEKKKICRNCSYYEFCYVEEEV